MFMTRISVVSHSEGDAITTRVAIDNPIAKIKNIALMAPGFRTHMIYCTTRSFAYHSNTLNKY